MESSVNASSLRIELPTVELPDAEMRERKLSPEVIPLYNGRPIFFR